MTVKGWAKLCMRVASNNMSSLETIFEVAEKYDPDSKQAASSSSM